MVSRLVSSSVIKDSGVAFGTSGARGLVSQFSSEVCAAFSIAFVSAIKSQFEFKRVALAIDNRPSSYGMAQSCALALAKLDIEVVYYGVVPTPALAYTARQEAIPAIMVTGSHIPFDRNGLKFYRPDGEISKDDEETIINVNVDFTLGDSLPELKVDDSATEAYISRYTSLFDSDWLSEKRIGVYEHSSAGRDLYFKIFEAFGAEVIRLGRSDEFVPIDTEAVSEQDSLKAKNWANDYDLDLIFSTDGDGDRPLVSDEKGNWLRGDILGLLTSDALKIEALSVPISCNTAIERCNLFSCVKRTKIGSPYVIAEFIELARKYSAVAGFEANGGYLLGSDVEVNGNLLKALPTRDAMLPVLMILMLTRSKYTSDLVGELPQRFTHSDRIENFETSKSQKLISQDKKSIDTLVELLGLGHIGVYKTNFEDGLRLILNDGKIIHLRPSGNAPELRCYAEAEEFSLAYECVVDSLKRIRAM